MNELQPDSKNELLLFFSSKYRKNIGEIIGDKDSLAALFLAQELFQKEREKMKMKLKDSDLVDSELSAIISRMPPELIRHIPPEARLVGLKPEDRLKGLQPEDRLKGLGTEEILKIIISKERLNELDPEKLASEQSKAALKKLKQLLDKLDLN